MGFFLILVKTCHKKYLKIIYSKSNVNLQHIYMIFAKFLLLFLLLSSLVLLGTTKKAKLQVVPIDCNLNRTDVCEAKRVLFIIMIFWSFYNFTENKLLTQKNSYKKTDLCKSVIKFRLLGYKFRSSIVIRRNMRSHTAFSVNWPFIANVVRSYWQNL